MEEKVEEKKKVAINDPYTLRLEANVPKVGNPETTEERENLAAGKIAERKDFPKGSSPNTATVTSTNTNTTTKGEQKK